MDNDTSVSEINWLDLKISIPSPTRLGKITEKRITVDDPIGSFEMTAYVVQFSGKDPEMCRTKSEAMAKLREFRAEDETANATREAAFRMSRLGSVNQKINRLVRSAAFKGLGLDDRSILHKGFLAIQATLADAIDRIPDETKKEILAYSAKVAEENSAING